MKRLLRIVVLVLLAAAGGAGGWWVWVRGGDPLQLLSMFAGEEPAAEAGFVKLDPLVLPIIQEGRVTQTLTLVVVLELRKGVAEGYVRARLPRLRDALITELHALMSLRAVRRRGAADPLIKRRLALAGRRVLGPQVLHRVLLRGLQMRPA